MLRTSANPTAHAGGTPPRPLPPRVASHAPRAAAPQAVAFTAEELREATSDFCTELGRGKFGTVYLGTLRDGRQVAVKQVTLPQLSREQQQQQQQQQQRKKMKKRRRFLPGRRRRQQQQEEQQQQQQQQQQQWEGGVEEGQQSDADKYSSETSFRRELSVLQCYRHRNLVCMYGWCFASAQQRARGQGAPAPTCSLVLEYLPDGSLLDRLDPANATAAQAAPLTAAQRCAIAADVARALHYLHAEAPTPLIHQDVKSDNVLLTRGSRGEIVAKVADFGTARIMPSKQQQQQHQAHHSTRVVVGTTPYMPGEYLQAGHVSEKTDTYAFGVVLLELLTGKPPFEEATGQLLVYEMGGVMRQHGNRLPLEALDARAWPCVCTPPASPSHSFTSSIRASFGSGWAAWGSGGSSGDGSPAGATSAALALSSIAARCIASRVEERCSMREILGSVEAAAATGAGPAAAVPVLVPLASAPRLVSSGDSVGTPPASPSHSFTSSIRASFGSGWAAWGSRGSSGDGGRAESPSPRGGGQGGTASTPASFPAPSSGVAAPHGLCSSCGHPLLQGAAFCTYCAALVRQAACMQCGARLRYREGVALDCFDCKKKGVPAQRR